MIFDPPFHDYSDIEPIQYPCRLEEEDTEKVGSSNEKLNFDSTKNENNDKTHTYFTPSEVIENESPLERMLTTLTGKTKSQRSTKDKAVKFPLKASILTNKISLIGVGWAQCTRNKLVPICFTCHSHVLFYLHS